MDIPKKLYDEIVGLLDLADLDREASHGINTLDWVLRINPDASLALQIAALGHDIERSVSPRYRREEFTDHAEYKKAHSERGAEILGGILNKHNLEQSVIEEAVELVKLHEVGGTEDADVLRDADSISFFDNNLEFYIGYKGLEEAKRQVEYKFGRCSSRAQSHIKQLEGYQRFVKGVEDQ